MSRKQKEELLYFLSNHLDKAFTVDEIKANIKSFRHYKEEWILNRCLDLTHSFFPDDYTPLKIITNSSDGIIRFTLNL